MNPIDLEFIKIADAAIHASSKAYLDSIQRLLPPMHDVSKNIELHGENGKSYLYSPEIISCLQSLIQVDYKRYLSPEQARYICSGKPVIERILKYFSGGVASEDMSLVDIFSAAFWEANVDISLKDKATREGIHWVPVKATTESFCTGCLYSVNGFPPSDVPGGGGMNLCDLYSDRLDFCGSGDELCIAIES